MRCSAFLFTLLWLSGCAFLTPRSLRFDDPFYNERIATIRANGQEADLVFVGTISDLGQAPSAWSGTIAHRQLVTYKVEKLFKGTLSSASITVDHVIVRGSYQADAAAPGLSPALFRTGARVIVFARQIGPGFFEDFDENVGVIPSSARNDLALELNL